MPDVAELVVRVKADTSQLTAGLAAARAQMSTFAAGAGATAAAASQKAAAGLAEAGAAARVVGSEMTLAGGVIVGALGLATKAGNDYQNKLLDVANNTTLTRGEIAQMDAAIRSLAGRSPASMEELAQGFMRVSNFGFHAADATRILDAAMKSAVATGAKTDATANALASAMKAFGFEGGQAVRVMNELHLAAAMGNETLEQFTAHSGRAHAQAAVFGVAIQDVDSALAALTRHGFNPAMAETQVLGMMNKINNPAKGVRDLLGDISQKTGVDLVNDFSAAGLKAKGLQGIIEDIRRAAAGLHMDAGVLAEKLIPAQRGGVGAAALSQDGGFGDKSAIMAKLTGALSGQVDATVSGFNERLKSLSSQVGILRNEFTLLGADVQRALVPVLVPLVQHVRDLITRFEALPEPVKRSLVQFTAIAGVSLLAGGALLSLVGRVLMIGSALLKVGTAVAGLVGEGGALAGLGAVLTGPVGIGIAAAIAAVALLVTAWVRDWGHIREVVGGFVAWIVPHLAAAWEAIRSTALAAWGPVKAFLLAIWPPIQQVTVTVWNFIRNFLTGLFLVLSELFAGTWTHIANVVRGAWDVIAGIFKVAFALVRSIFEVGLKLLVGDWDGAWKSCLSIQKLAVDGIGQLLGGLVKIFGGLIGTIAQTIYNLGSDLVTIGKFIVSGIWNGIVAAWNGLADGLDHLVESLVARVKGALGIRSPSRVFEGIGQQIGLGLAAGLAGTRDLVHGAMGALAPPGLSFAGGGGYVGPPGRVIPQGGDRGDTHVHMTVITPDAGSFVRSRSQVLSDYQRGLEYAAVRGGG